MSEYVQQLIILIVAILGSGGFWNFMMLRRDKKDVKRHMLLALGHDRLLTLCQHYLTRGSITVDELTNLEKLYTAYEELDGNGVIAKMIQKVRQLHILNSKWE